MKILYTLSLLLFSSSVFAFGGSGGTEMLKKQEETAGFDALGLHFGPDGQATIDFKPGAYWCRAGKISQCMQQLNKDEPDVFQCASNADCAAGQYCNIVGGNKEDKNENEPISSSCVSMSPSSATEIVWNSKRFLKCTTYNECETTMWGARNWCAAHNMRLITLKDLGIDASKRGFFCDKNRDSDIYWAGMADLLTGRDYWHTDTPCNSGNTFTLKNESDIKCVYGLPYSGKVYILCTYK